MREAEVGLFVVDEAHCVSRGVMISARLLRLADAARKLDASALIAPPPPQRAGGSGRGAAPALLRTRCGWPRGFDRPNITSRWRGRQATRRAGGWRSLGGRGRSPAIAYAGTRAGSEELASDLTAALGEEAVAYHAGLRPRAVVPGQRRFLADDVRVICANNAFGMAGTRPTSAPSCRSVPSSLEAYYQEPGEPVATVAPAGRCFSRRTGTSACTSLHQREDSTRPAGLVGGPIIAAADGDDRYFSSTLGTRPGPAWGRGPPQGADRPPHPRRSAHAVAIGAGPDRRAVAGRFDGRAAALCRPSIEEAARARWRQYREIWACVEEGSCRRTAISGTSEIRRRRRRRARFL